MSRDPSFMECAVVVLSGPFGLGAVILGISGGEWLIGLIGLVAFLWSLFMWHKAISGYYSE